MNGKIIFDIGYKSAQSKIDKNVLKIRRLL